MPAPIGRSLLAFASFRKRSFHLRETLRILGGKIIGLRKVSIELVEFPHVLSRIPRCQAGAYRQPRCQRTERARKPAIVINTAAAIIIEKLGRLLRWRRCIGKRVGHAHAVDWVLFEPVDDLGRR